MDEIGKLLDFLTHYGLYGVLLIAIVLLVHDPSRAEKLKIAFLTPFFRLFKWGAKQYLASKVALSVSEFYKHQLAGFLSSPTKWKFKIRWVLTPTDPVLKKNGTLILRLEETNDQTRNILSATKVALTMTVFPTLRSQIQSNLQNAIDLTLLRKLSERLGKHAYPIFATHFLQPQLGDTECTQLLAELLELDSAGLFVAIFLEELNLLADYTYSQNDLRDKTEAIRRLLTFLLGLARREEGGEIELDHVSEDVQVGILLLAKTQRAVSEGVVPYVKRIGIKIKRGCNTLYIVAFKPAIPFQNAVVRAIAQDSRITVAKISRIPVKSGRRERRDDCIVIAQLNVGPGFLDREFEANLKEQQIKEGDLVSGVLLDVAEQVALVNVQGVTGMIDRRRCSWRTVGSCSDVLSIGDECRFQVHRIDADRGMLMLTRRFADEDPFLSAVLPAQGDVVGVKVTFVTNEALIADLPNGLEVEIPLAEVSWESERPGNSGGFLGKRFSVVVYDVNRDEHVIRASIRQMTKDPWPELHARFPVGTKIRSRVTEVDRKLHFVRVQLVEGISGIIPAESMRAGGHEYRDFESTLTVGQVLDVVVVKVFIKKRRIRLDLARNREELK
jgi:predicted RNA-binding protein with RPS1 domain